MTEDPEILPPVTPPALPAGAARRLVSRLVRSGTVPEDLLALVDGKLAEAVATAADYV
jgi:hypothetical protein